MPKTKQINLLPQEEFDASVIGRALKWAMGTFRIIVIVTEMIVMGAFLSRFWLDAQNSDLTNAIKIKTAQISAQSEFEKQFRDIQLKLNVIGKIRAENNSTSIAEGIILATPAGITFSGLSILADNVQIKGTSISELSIQQLMANLATNKTFKEVELGQISSSESDISKISFVIKITL